MHLCNYLLNNHYLCIIIITQKHITMKNIKTVKITVPNEQILKRMISTPALSRLSRIKLQVGENIENVNHTQYADMVRIYPIIGVTVEEILQNN